MDRPRPSCRTPARRPPRGSDASANFRLHLKGRIEGGGGCNGDWQRGQSVMMFEDERREGEIQCEVFQPQVVYVFAPSQFICGHCGRIQLHLGLGFVWCEGRLAAAIQPLCIHQPSILLPVVYCFSPQSRSFIISSNP